MVKVSATVVVELELGINSFEDIMTHNMSIANSDTLVTNKLKELYPGIQVKGVVDVLAVD